MNAHLKWFVFTFLISNTIFFWRETFPQTHSTKTDSTRAAAFYEKARVLRGEAQHDSARVYFEKARDLYDKIEDWRNYVKSCNQVGQQLWRKRANRKAITYLHEHVLQRFVDKPVDEKTNLEISESLAHIAIAHALLREYEKSLQFFQSSLNTKITVLGEDHRAVAVICTNIGNVYRRMREFRKAADYYNRGLNIRRRVSDERSLGFAQSYISLSNLYSAYGDYNKALEYAHKTLEIDLLWPDRVSPRNVVAIYGNLSLLYRRKGDYKKALEYAQHGLNFAIEKLGADHAMVSSQLDNIAKALRLKGDYQRALDYYNRVLAFEPDSTGLLGLYNNISNVHTDLQEYEKALEYLNKAVTIGTSLRNPYHQDLGDPYNNIGNAYRALGENQKAFEYLNKALTIYLDELGEKNPVTAECYQNIGRTHLNMGDYSKAVELTNRVLNIRRDLFGSLHPAVAASYLVLAAAHEKQRNFTTALRYEQQALMSVAPGFNDTDIAANPGLAGNFSKKDLLEILAAKARTLRESYLAAADDLEFLHMSLSTYRLAADLIDQMRTGYRAEESRLFLGQEVFTTYSEAVETALELYRITGESEYQEAAMQLAAKSKAGTLLTALLESNARQFSNLPDTLLQEESQLRIDLAYYETQIQKEKRKKEDSDTLKIQDFEKRFFDLNVKYDRLVENLDLNYPRYYDLKHQGQIPTMSELREALDSKTAVVEYFVGEEAVSIFTVTKDGNNVISFKKDAAFDSWIAAFRKAIKKVETGAFVNASARLNDLLIRPIEKQIASKEKLTIIPHGVLYTIPFEALLQKRPATAVRLDFTKLDFLINHFDVSYHYSTTLYLQSLREKTLAAGSAQSAGFLGFAPVFADQPQTGYLLTSKYPVQKFEFSDEETRAAIIDGRRFRELKYSQTEVESLIKEYEKHGRAGVAFFHGDASEENFKKQARNYKYIHIATHGLIHADAPRLSGIVFAQPTDSTASEDGILYAAETYNLELNADLITLSSCESGIGKLVRGEGLLALTRGFLYSGARNIIVSLWKVSDKHASQLMVDLYKNILSGKGYALSLREAKLQMLKKPATAFPKSWSSFVLIGK
jgi:CHAT domain-containing protein/Flp pilus assembly protein TadD